MKHLFYFVLLCAVTLFIACENDTADSLTIDYVPVAILETGGSTTFTIHTNMKWTAESNVSWITIIPKSGTGDKTVTVTVKNNTAEESDTPSRAAKIYITAGANTEVLSINQQESNLPVSPAPVISGLSSNECPFFTKIQLTIAPVEYAVSYTWYNGPAVIQSGTATTCEVVESGLYTVAGVNKVGREGIRSLEKPVAITHCMPDAAPTITGASANNCYATTDRNSVMLSVPEILHATYYVWRRNGIPIINASASTYIATESGTYTVTGANSIGQGADSPGKPVSISKCLELGVGKTYKVLTVDKAILNTPGGNSLVDPFLTNIYDIMKTASYYVRSFTITFGTNPAQPAMSLTLSFPNIANTATYTAIVVCKVNEDPDGLIYFTDLTNPGTTGGNNFNSIRPGIQDNLVKYLLYSSSTYVSSSGTGTAYTMPASGNKFKVDWAPNLTPGLPGSLGALYPVSDPSNYMPGTLQ